MSSLYDCGDPDQRSTGLRHAVDALRRGELVVLPTDTVYGVGADAFSAEAVADLLTAKGRGREKPPPVLVPDARTLDALAVEVPASAKALVERFWPGALTVICWAQPSLHWDLGETNGTVAVRMPHDEVALELLRSTGPLAVSSANLTGRPPARTAAEAREQLGDTVAAYLESGPAGEGAPSTIVDLTTPVPRVVRLGALSLEQLREVVPELEGPDGESAAAPAEPPAAEGGTPVTASDVATDAAPAEEPRQP